MTHLVILLLLNPLVRSYTVDIQGVGTGSYEQRFTDKDGGIEIATVSSLRAKVSIFSYRYNFSSVETWKLGKLTAATATRDDNGTVEKIAAWPGMADWTTSFWTLPDNRQGTIKVLDYDTGRIVPCTLAFVGIDKTGRHWKVSGGVETDLWYDQDGLLVKRMMLRKGRQATVTLTRS